VYRDVGAVVGGGWMMMLEGVCEEKEVGGCGCGMDVSEGREQGRGGMGGARSEEGSKGGMGLGWR
jgi:hypothetical protein